MIITPDCDQFNTVISFNDNWTLKNSIGDTNYRFMPRELFNMIQLQNLNLEILNLFPYGRKILNVVPTSLRRNLKNINHRSLSGRYNNLYINTLINYLNGNNFTNSD